MVSGSFSLPSRGSFHLSLTVLFAIGRLVVFSLWGWSPLSSIRIPRARIYSGASQSAPLVYRAVTFFGSSFQMILFRFAFFMLVLTPEELLLPVWAVPRSLAATWGIEFSFFSSGYLDVSVPRVPFIYPLIYDTYSSISEFPHSEIYNCDGCLLLVIAFRSLPRPSSALIA